MNLRFLICCVGSGILGGIVALALAVRRAPAPLQAEERDRDRSGPAFPESHRSRSAGAHAAPTLGSPLAPDALSTEEQINIAVYENVNRGVVHITTRGVRAEKLFLLEVPT